MADKPPIALYTSIPPQLRRAMGKVEYGDAYQKECVDSWISGGFRVVSVNREAEIPFLASKFPQVEFVDSGTDDVRTRIQIFLQKVAASGDGISGIINADCYLLDAGSIADRLRFAAQGSVVLLRRINIDGATMRPTGRKCPGFDGFLFDTSFLGQIEDLGNWAIGTPWWDYWFPIA